jgi:hypothetical protein
LEALMRKLMAIEREHGLSAEQAAFIEAVAARIRAGAENSASPVGAFLGLSRWRARATLRTAEQRTAHGANAEFGSMGRARKSSPRAFSAASAAVEDCWQEQLETLGRVGEKSPGP